MGSVQREKFKGIKATSHSPIFDIPMRLVREDQRNRRRFTVWRRPAIPVMVIIPLNFARCTLPTHGNRQVKSSLHLTISMRGKRATGKIQRNNYRHGCCLPSLTGKTMSVFLIFTQGTNQNVKNRRMRSSLNYHHRSCGTSLTGNTSSVSLIFK